MIKVRTFRSDAYDEEKLDKDVNEFLKQKIVVRNITACSGGGNSGGTYLFAQVVYEDGTSEGSEWVRTERPPFAFTEPDIAAPREG
jgi:hypothetical protein